MAFDNLMVFSGSANPKLAQQVARQLNIQLGKATVSKFSDGEIMVELLENVRGKDVFVLQSTCAPTNDHLMELMIMCDALRRSSAARITAALPYFGYARRGGEHAHRRRGEPVVDDGSARRPDPGFLRHPGG